MPGFKTSEGVQVVEKLMKDVGGNPAEWYVGVSHHGDDRLKQHGMQGKPYAGSWEFESEDAATAAERYFLDCGVRPDAREPEAQEPDNGKMRTQLYVFHAPRLARFRQFLERAEKQQDPENKRANRRQEWLAAVDRLIGQLVAWVQEVDPSGLLIVMPFRISQTEIGLGTYEAPGLTIHLKDTIVQVRPVARNVVGTVKLSPEKELKAQGRVDVTDGSKRYTLYRTLLGGEERWHVVDEESNTAELDQNQFMAVLEDLFS